MKKFLRSTIYNSSTLRGKQQIGFIGLGNMGGGMVKNLNNIYDVKAYDAIPATREKYANEGITMVNDISEIANNDQITQVVLMLPAAQHVKSICEGDDGLFNKLQKGSKIIDCSTIGPAAATEMYESGLKHGQQFIDAPVSGGVMAAAGGTLTFMVGSHNADQFTQVKSVLDPMAKNVFDCQKPAGGQITKAANNMALAIQMMSIAEALTLGKKLGMDPKVLSSVMNTASAQCWSLSLYNPCPGILETVPASKDWEGGFASALMLKDLGLAMDAAKSVDASTPLGNHAKNIYQQLVDDGLDKKDFGVVYDQLMKNKI